MNNSVSLNGLYFNIHIRSRIVKQVRIIIYVNIDLMCVIVYVDLGLL